MIVGASYPIHSGDAAFAMTSGAADADYPVSNLADPKAITLVFRASAPGAISFSFVLPADRAVEFLALCRHNNPGGETWRIQLYDNAGLTSEVYDSGALTISSSTAGQVRPTEPHKLVGGPLTIRGGVITLSAHAAAWQIGALIVSGFWDLSAHDARALGILPRDGRTDVGDGVSRGTRQFSPRAYTFGNSQIDWTTDGRTFHDFQRDMKLSEPFVWVRDYGDPDTWARECDLVRNQSRPALGKNAWVLGELALDTISHLAGP